MLNVLPRYIFGLILLPFWYFEVENRSQMMFRSNVRNLSSRGFREHENLSKSRIVIHNKSLAFTTMT